MEECRVKAHQKSVEENKLLWTYEEIFGGWRKSHKEEVYDLCTISVMFRLIKSKIM